MRKRTGIRIALALALLLMATLVFYMPAAADNTTQPAAEPQKDRDIVLSTQYTNYVVQQDKNSPTITVPFELDNFGKQAEDITVTISKVPQDWKGVIKSGGNEVRSFFLLSQKNTTLDLVLTPPTGAKHADYQFQVKAATSDGALQSTVDLTLGLAAAAQAAPQQLKLATAYPILRGASGASFEFKVDITNGTGKDQNVNLAGQAPQGWDVSFQPAYDQKQISSLSIKTGETQSVNVEVKSAADAVAGKYPIQVAATTDKSSTAQQITLEADITGSYMMDLTTATGRLNANATAGKSTSVSMVITNRGSAALQNITFTASNPNGWNVTFTPDKIDSMNPGEQRQVVATIKPASKAIAGDYSISLTGSAGTASAKSDLRITVDTPTAWGWIGIGALVVVIGGLSGLFVYLGRR